MILEEQAILVLRDLICTLDGCGIAYSALETFAWLLVGLYGKIGRIRGSWSGEAQGALLILSYKKGRV